MTVTVTPLSDCLDKICKNLDRVEGLHHPVKYLPSIFAFSFLLVLNVSLFFLRMSKVLVSIETGDTIAWRGRPLPHYPISPVLIQTSKYCFCKNYNVDWRRTRRTRTYVPSNSSGCHCSALSLSV